jgi:hypothetical protein
VKAKLPHTGDVNPEDRAPGPRPHTTRSTIIFLISAIALAGFSPLGQVLAQFMMVWQRSVFHPSDTHTIAKLHVEHLLYSKGMIYYKVKERTHRKVSSALL